MPKKLKKKEKKTTPKKKEASGIAPFSVKCKLLALVVILVFLFFFFIRQEETISALKEQSQKIIDTAPKEKIEITYKSKTTLYLNHLKNKYSGYGRKVSLADAKKAVEKACNYIAKAEGHSYWNSENAKDILLATAVVESDLRARYSQYGGNAVGIFQVEYITFKDFWERAIPKSYPKLYKALQKDYPNMDFEILQNDDTLCGIFARLVYARAKTSIPYRKDIYDQAAYYKKHYNTHLGKAKTNVFVKKKNAMHLLK